MYVYEYMCLCVHVWCGVCVHVRERESKRDRERERNRLCAQCVCLHVHSVFVWQGFRELPSGVLFFHCPIWGLNSDYEAWAVGSHTHWAILMTFLQWTIRLASLEPVCQLYVPVTKHNTHKHQGFLCLLGGLSIVVTKRTCHHRTQWGTWLLATSNLVIEIPGRMLVEWKPRAKQALLMFNDSGWTLHLGSKSQ